MPLDKEILQPYKRKIFVETGTRFGYGVQTALDVGFEKIYSIEINEELFQKSWERFRNNEKVILIKGDSKNEFIRILKQIQEPATIWLDAHTAIITPLMNELGALLQHPIKNHTLLIDDVRDLKNVYKMKIDDVVKKLKEINPNYHISFIDNTRYPNNILVAQERRILYIDHFTKTNSNAYWLKAFKKFGQVETHEIVGTSDEFVREKIMRFKPHHIHLGGSVKNGLVPPDFLSDIKRKLNCTISLFYGDAKYSEYHAELSKVVDNIYVTNKTHIKINEEKGLKNFKYLPCPTDPETFKHYKSTFLSKYDVVFIGNNYQASRLLLLNKLNNRFNLKVFGIGWENTGYNSSGPVFGEEFSKVCSKSKINISIIASEYEHLESYFSNRLVNVLATGCFFICKYTPGLEKIFTNKKHLVWYKNETELFELIKYYLVNEKEREEIAIAGQEEVRENWTYENGVRMILGEKINEKYPPWLAKDSIKFLDSILTKDSMVLDVGSGNSTVWFAERVKKVISFENKKEWYDKVKKILDRKGLKNVDFYFDVDYPTKGIPDFNILYDVILIDGRGRLKCVETSIKFLKSGGFLILDNSDNEKYKPIVDLLDNLGWKRKDFKGAWMTSSWRKNKK